jgi:hypothetical protein
MEQKKPLPKIDYGKPQFVPRYVTRKNIRRFIKTPKIIDSDLPDAIKKQYKRQLPDDLHKLLLMPNLDLNTLYYCMPFIAKAVYDETISDNSLILLRSFLEDKCYEELKLKKPQPTEKHPQTNESKTTEEQHQTTEKTRNISFVDCYNQIFNDGKFNETYSEIEILLDVNSEFSSLKDENIETIKLIDSKWVGIVNACKKFFQTYKSGILQAEKTATNPHDARSNKTTMDHLNSWITHNLKQVGTVFIKDNLFYWKDINIKNPIEVNEFIKKYNKDYEHGKNY